jgi:Na+-transporting NADH:ubiquinone oxidoreductase subunit B
MPIKKYFLKQKVMIRVSFSLTPIMLFAVYLFGWRSFFITLAVLLFGIATEAHFTVREGKPVTSAILVTCLIYSLSLPPTTPFWIAIIGIITGVTFGKMVFGGFGQNIYNPAMVGRCFIYIAFPKEMTGSWIEPMWGGAGGFTAWKGTVDAVTRATPLMQIQSGSLPSVYDLIIGKCSGSMGETSVILILAAGLYLIIKKAAPWRLALSCISGGLIAAFSLRIFMAGPPILYTFISGAFLFGSFFIVTEPITGPKTTSGQLIYGFIVGGLTVILREYSNFSEGFMFSILLMNAFVPLIDMGVKQTKQTGQTEK